MHRYITYIQFIHMQSQHQVVQSLGRPLSATIGWRDNKSAAASSPGASWRHSNRERRGQPVVWGRGCVFGNQCKLWHAVRVPDPSSPSVVVPSGRTGGRRGYGEVLLASLRPNVGPRCCAVWKHRMPTWRRGSVVPLEPTLLNSFCVIQFFII